ncbi:hypothetical protein, partial [Enterococcus faecium]|uniref:hypothetical protein n=1 Tax=Enterococcus faecium TaxID=1352 RepID=UPI0019632A26
MNSIDISYGLAVKKARRQDVRRGLRASTRLQRCAADCTVAWAKFVRLQAVQNTQDVIPASGRRSGCSPKRAGSC